MEIVKNTIGAVLKRPFIIIFLGLVTLGFSVVNYFNPLIPILTGLNAVTGGNLLDSLVSYLQLLLDIQIVPILTVFVVAFTIISSLLAGLLFSGFFNIINFTLARKAKSRGEFNEGLKKYFLRITLITLRVVVFCFAFAIFMMVASVPAAIVTKAASISRPELIIAAGFIDILTAGVLFFGLMFFRAYMFFWYPSAINNEKKYFKRARCIVDANFWYIVRRFLIFDVAFILFELLKTRFKSDMVLLFSNWLFTTVFLTFFTVFIFSVYRKFEKEKN